MSRSVTSAAQTVLDASNVPLCVFVEMAFGSGTLRMTNAGVSMPWDGYTWLGAGALADVEPVEEALTPSAQALNVRFSGIDAGNVSIITGEQYQGLPAKIWVAPLNADTLRPVIDPVLVFEGRMDEPEIVIGDTATITLGLENRFADWDRPRNRTFSDADQVNRYPGDKGFEYAAQTEATSITWGTYRGPVAPDPLKLANRMLDKALSNPVGKILLAPFGITKPTVNLARNIGDRVAKIFGW